MEQPSSARLGNLDCPRGLHSEATAIQDIVAKQQKQDAGKSYCSSCRDLGERKAVIFLQKKKNTLPLVSHCYCSWLFQSIGRKVAGSIHTSTDSLRDSSLQGIMEVQ